MVGVALLDVAGCRACPHGTPLGAYSPEGMNKNKPRRVRRIYLKAVWGAKGAAGLRCCMLCRSVASLHAELTTNQDYLLDVSCADVSTFDLAEDQDIWDAWDKLAAKRNAVSRVVFGELEKAGGFSYTEDGLPSDRELRRFIRPASVTTMDWFHNWLQNGVSHRRIDERSLSEAKRARRRPRPCRAEDRPRAHRDFLRLLAKTTSKLLLLLSNAAKPGRCFY